MPPALLCPIVSPNRSVRQRPPLFRALGREDPPPEIEINGRTYRRTDILKHDSWAATALYRGEAGQIVCKFNRQQPICGIPVKWLGQWLARHEGKALERLADLPNIPNSCGQVCAGGKLLTHAVAHAYVKGHPLGALERVGDDFFPTMQKLLGELHRRDIAYVDLHKRENIIVGDDGQPYLIDFQICVNLSGGLARYPLLRTLLRLLCRADHYHLLKHFARNRPDQCGVTIEDMCGKRPWCVRVHRWLAQPFRKLRRALLVGCGVRSGRGDASTELFPEEAVRRDRAGSVRAAA